jgi:hypothetical protein
MCDRLVFRSSWHGKPKLSVPKKHPLGNIGSDTRPCYGFLFDANHRARARRPFLEVSAENPPNFTLHTSNDYPKFRSGHPLSVYATAIITNQAFFFSIARNGSRHSESERPFLACTTKYSTSNAGSFSLTGCNRRSSRANHFSPSAAAIGLAGLASEITSNTSQLQYSPRRPA